MKKVTEILRSNSERTVQTIGPSASVLDAIKVMAERNIGALVVMENEKMLGIITERDYARKVILKGRSSKETAVREIMTAPVVCVHSDQTNEDKRPHHLQGAARRRRDRSRDLEGSAIEPPARAVPMQLDLSRPRAEAAQMGRKLGAYFIERKSWSMAAFRSGLWIARSWISHSSSPRTNRRAPSRKCPLANSTSLRRSKAPEWGSRLNMGTSTEIATATRFN
jgi:hypothetical protein